MIAVGIIIFFVLNDKEEAPSVEVKKEDGASQNTSMTSVLRDKTIWLIAFNVFCLRGLLWPDILHSIPEKHLSIARCAGGAYGIINQYCLKMIGGPIGGMISDKYPEIAE